MKPIPLPDLVAEKGQAAVAKALGVSPPAITKALSADRKIFITIHEDGSYEAQELRPFPTRPKKSVA